MAPLSGRIYTCEARIATDTKRGSSFQTDCIAATSVDLESRDLPTECSAGPIRLAGPFAQLEPERWPMCAGDTVPLYDVDFGPPDHQIGEEPFLDQDAWPRRGPSGLQGGSGHGVIYPHVELRLGGLTDQPLVLGDGDAALFDLDAGLSFYRIDFDMLTASDYRAYGWVFDMEIYAPQRWPDRNSVSFNRLGLISAHEPGEPVGNSFALGYHKHGDAVQARIDVDLLYQRWRVWLDGAVYHVGRFEGADLESLILETIPSVGLDGAVGIDNVRVIGCGSSAVITPTSTSSPSPTTTPAPSCRCDCNGNGLVDVNELLIAVRSALGESPIDSCAAADHNGDRMIGVDELIAGVNAALGGCSNEPSRARRETRATEAKGLSSLRREGYRN